MRYLPIEECQWLKSKGFPQDGHHWNYWDELHTDGDKITNEISLSCEANRWSADDNFVCACPDLEELLEWGIKKLKHKFPFWSLSGTHRGYCCKYGVETENGGCYYHQTTNDPDPKLALVKLLKQVLGD